MKFEIPIEPKPQSRPRAAMRGGRATVYEDGKMVVWRKKCTELVRQLYDGPYFDGPIKVDMTFYTPAPKSMSEPPKPRSRAKKVRQYDDFINERIYVDKKPDLDNLEKAVYDSISKAGCVWTDDNIIVEHTTRKLYSPRPRIEIEVEEIL
ncbi:RusA family crossover junction endodeoxyribonuclease [Streptococcus suis]|uniref:RusA family crossover junction endodeoxyribonuclease n=1 Tax=Streptococcus suis TaxID=1307 RepID=UPI0005CF4386|nr:RusA family crossover junction endodeoxyribonuclease [Streptococcus suis]MBS0708679.1 RusA family crossover junction endodeoxyribonuclease [Streptococcus suis]MBS0723617.1 RusA family crossover junction endodeoxyribonuclease [Streptococcus suis]MBS8063971.1 RusA family crossover junction endodeoxyribonuclease [Streptococcus suis]MBS8090582.1 RusA family crossover junction endodeoxyribonuclease [Streptococcus suis]MCG9920346.1 RusA family crossover junction endodeoxyribonuclease [Streptococc